MGKHIKCQICSSSNISFNNNQAYKYQKDLIVQCNSCKAIIDFNKATIFDSANSNLDEYLLSVINKEKPKIKTGYLFAIREYKRIFGGEISEAKSYVDKLTQEHNIEVKKGCFIATACYGDYDSPEVIVLRNYRDNILLQSNGGKLFVNAYYKTSPFIAKIIYKSNILKNITKTLIVKPFYKMAKNKMKSE